MLSGEHARSIRHAISTTARVTPDAMVRIVRSILAQIDQRSERACETAQIDLVGAILTASFKQMRKEVLADVNNTEPNFAKLVRETIFTFKDTSKRIAPKDLAKARGPINQKDLVAALGLAKTASLMKPLALCSIR